MLNEHAIFDVTHVCKIIIRICVIGAMEVEINVVHSSRVVVKFREVLLEC